MNEGKEQKNKCSIIKIMIPLILIVPETRAIAFCADQKKVLAKVRTEKQAASNYQSFLCLVSDLFICILSAAAAAGSSRVSKDGKAEWELKLLLNFPTTTND